MSGESVEGKALKAPVGCITVKPFNGEFVLFKDCVSKVWFWMKWENKWKESIGYKTLDEAEKAKKKKKLEWHHGE